LARNGFFKLLGAGKGDVKPFAAMSAMEVVRGGESGWKEQGDSFRDGIRQREAVKSGVI